jgi:hypothetical protein
MAFTPSLRLIGLTASKQKVEFGDFQTPHQLAQAVCKRLVALGINPKTVIEPTCGTGAFLLAAEEAFPDARRILGFEVSHQYLGLLTDHLAANPSPRVSVEQADFFSTNWHTRLDAAEEPILVVGNFPWVTNSVQGAIGGTNLPEKSNFQRHRGFDAITGKANFDISEWMLLEVMNWLGGKTGDVAMLMKTAVARKLLSHAERQSAYMTGASIFRIDAKKHFGASVDACLLVMRLSSHVKPPHHDYTLYDSLDAEHGKRMGHRMGLSIGDLDSFEQYRYLVGESPQKWRSGIKHDASNVMEFSRTESGMLNGLGERIDLEPTYLFPLMKGSDIGSGKPWRGKFVLVTQRRVGQPTDEIQNAAPRTWQYLDQHRAQLEARGSAIYAKAPRFAIFGIGDYAFKPWKIAICGLYKHLAFRLIGPIEDRPVMFDDTVYFVSFDTESEARAALDDLQSEPATRLLSALVFWDEKRPIKTAVLNVLNWRRASMQAGQRVQVLSRPVS